MRQIKNVKTSQIVPKTMYQIVQIYKQINIMQKITAELAVFV